MPDAFVTGGSGFIGGALISRLVGEGRDVVGLARSDGAVEAVTALGARPVRGDMTRVADWGEHLGGVPTLFHVAGVNETCLRDPGVLDRVNVDGTIAVVRAAARAGVGRVVLTSSAAAIGERAGETGSEETIHSGRYLSAYAASKHRSETAAFEEARRLDVDLVSVNPSSVQGPGRVAGTGRIFLAYLQGRLRWAVRTQVALVYIDDCVAGHLLAAESGVSGRRYLLSGWNAPVEEMIEVLSAVTDTPRRVRYLPGWLLTVTGGAAEAAWRLLGRRPPICRELARTIRHGHRFDGSRATRELGLEYTPPGEWLSETVEWYQEHGLV